MTDSKAKDLEYYLNDRTKERDGLTTRFNTLKKEHDILLKEE